MAVSKRPRRLHVLLPNTLLLEIDERVGKGRRSEFIREAVAEKLEYLRRMRTREQAVMSGVDTGIPERENRELAAK